MLVPALTPARKFEVPAVAVMSSAPAAKVTSPACASVPLISTLPLISISVEFNSISSSALMSRSPSASDLILIAESRN